MHRLLIGEWPNLSNPRFYSEVSTRELLKDNNLLASIAGDKDLSKVYAKGLCSEIQCVNTRWVGEDPEAIPEAALEGAWIVKLNAGSGVFARGQGPEDRLELEAFMKSHRKDPAPGIFGSRYYDRARQGFIIEDYLDSAGQRPVEVRYYCFGGKVEFGSILSFQGDDRHDWYVDRENDPLDHVGRRGAPEKTKPLAAPGVPMGMFETGRSHAERLAVGFGHVRVDLNFLNGDIWFGELTPFPASGLYRFRPSDFDRDLATKWRRAVEG